MKLRLHRWLVKYPRTTCAFMRRETFTTQFDDGPRQVLGYAVTVYGYPEYQFFAYNLEDAVSRQNDWRVCEVTTGRALVRNLATRTEALRQTEQLLAQVGKAKFEAAIKHYTQNGRKKYVLH